jgi:uncharacterized membrane protein YqjE
VTLASETMSMSANKETALLSLVRELVDALGELVAGHLRLARAELGGDARRLARRAALVGLAGSFGLVGYGLACVAAALALAPALGAPLAFLTLGGVHLVGAAVGLGLLLGRAAPHPLEGALAAIDKAVETVESAETVRTATLGTLGSGASGEEAAPPRVAPVEALAAAVEGAAP